MESTGVDYRPAGGALLFARQGDLAGACEIADAEIFHQHQELLDLALVAGHFDRQLVRLDVDDLGAENIVYISCNPSTQARDTNSLIHAGYALEKLSFVDQFPHTGHIESIAKYKFVGNES